MAGFIKDNIGEWKNVVPRIKINETGNVSDWKRPDSGWIKTASGWRQWYAGNVPDPTLTVASTTTTSATITISNYNASITYTDLASTAGTVSRSAQTITVTGLSAGQEITVSIRATLLGTPSELGQITTSATPATPTFGTSTNVTFTSFTVPITNYNVLYNYSVTVSAGTFTRTAESITVSGLSGPGTSSQISVTATTTQNRASAVGQITRSTNSLATPTIDANTPTLNGFTITLGNVQAGYTYAVTVSPSTGITVTQNSSTQYTVSGATSNTTYTASVIGSISGYNTSSVSDTITTLSLINPGPPDITSNVRSLVASIPTANYDASYTYSWSINPSAGTLSISGRTATWTGLTPNTPYTISVFGTISGTNTSIGSRTASTLARWTTTGTVSSTNYPGYTLLTFQSSGSITYNEAINSVRAAVAGGGGAGGGTGTVATDWRVASGGGGGGQVITATLNEPAVTRAVAIGSGGAVNGPAAASSSYASTLIATGGGSGLYYNAIPAATWNGLTQTQRNNNAQAPTSPGGSTGGGSGISRAPANPVTSGAGPARTAPTQQGAGGSGYYRSDSNTRNAGGGGGGAAPQNGVAGATPESGNQGGTYWGADFDGGGVGATGRQLFSTELNQPAGGFGIYVGGGGGGGGATRNGPLGGTNNLHGLAFFGGGGTGTVVNQNGTGTRSSTAGTANTGGGGGGGFNAVTDKPNNGSNGGSGVVYLLIPN
jgi:hypothetical protein